MLVITPRLLLILTFSFVSHCLFAQTKELNQLNLYTADNPLFQYTGRIDFSHPKTPRYWMPGVYVTARFSGTSCLVLINDEMLYGNFHNYIEVAVDDQQPVRLRLTATHNEIDAGKNLADGDHTIVICKNTEAGIGYIEFAGIKCKTLRRLPKKTNRKIECIGNSITCGTGSDQSEIACGKGLWQDQHNAYMSYGAITARNLGADYHLTAVSGIGLMHSCCGLKIVMPQVFDKINMRMDSIAWNFTRYTPDVVTICLGQNDGMQDSSLFCNNYLKFIEQVRARYPKAEVICLTSPMADDKLAAVMKTNLLAIVRAAQSLGDKRISSFFFSKRYYHGCDTHPDLEEHRQIASELTAYLKELKHW